MRTNTKLRDMNIAVSATDERAIEVLASRLPMHPGAQLAVDITMRSALTGDGMGNSRAAHTDGVTLARARTDKERKCHELVHGEMCQLVVVALVRGGRWSAEAVDFIYPLTGSRAREAPPLLGRLSTRGTEDGRGCCPCLAPERSRVLWCVHGLRHLRCRMALLLIWPTSSPRE